eukprot:gnl/Dysnectes_brevis/2670_a3232_1141.p1 GENE.gnl/Dysnectes_brevis/2670_a3232_1141~~gnl/Dysnectes_brevis/2670_a3232_1141.p1  ORF type:complete len:250 (+),score=59.22 gnl/Dysnectes_brevis/2670_a3232_1141:38-751(+)
MKRNGVGNMSGAYFVGRQELLRWLSDFLELVITKIEDASSGAHYCQLLDALFPGQIPLHRVKFNPTLEWEKERNFKLVQDVLARNGIDRVVDINKLIKGRYLDNLEFLQWFKFFFEHQHSGEHYPAAAIREKAGRGRRGPAARREPHSTTSKAPAPAPAARRISGGAPDPQLLRKMDKLQRERQFYFDKLREIELYMGELGSKIKEGGLEDTGPLSAVTIVKAIEGVLYEPYTGNSK